ncbi:porin-like protein [Pacificibacter maritimus]|uniref:Porin-like protein n=1 Tax=Pacificibacter maritimus TaxID=762213 RepID=A0A3N4UN94_9RHOB|nr:porin [Pacificibacter maritimus]RPE71488.1 porin-like protein [Pacificibacter maritimus]
MKNIAIALTSLAAISAAPAFAETTYLSFDLGYSELSEGGETLETLSGAAAFEGKTGKFTYGAELAGTEIKIGGDEANVSEISAILGYDITPAITAFVGASSVEFDTEEATYYTAGAEYAFGDFTVGAAYITTEVDDIDTDGGQAYVDYDTAALDAYFGVAFAEDEDEIYFAGLSRDVDTYEVDFDTIIVEDLNVYTLSGSYNVRENIRVNASVDYFDIDGEDLTQASIGAGYMVADDIWVDASYNTLEIDGENVDGFGLAVSFETGDRGLRASERVMTAYDVLAAVPVFGGR